MRTWSQRLWHARRRALDEDGFTLTEVLMAITISFVIAGVIGSAMVVGFQGVTANTTRLDESHDAQLAAAYFVADAANASSFSKTAVAPAWCATGGTTVAQFAWSDSGAKTVSYIVNPAVAKPAPTHSELWRCFDDNGVQSHQSLVKHLGGSAPVVTCPFPEDPACGSNPADVQLGVQATSGYAYTLRATTRTTGPGSSALGGFAVLVGGDMILKGNSVIVASSGVVAVGGSTTCAGSGSNVTAPDGFYGSSTGGCGPDVGSPPPDPLAGVPDPIAPIGPVNPASSTTTACGTSQKTYQPGLYTAAVNFSSACLASGTYFLNAGGSMDTVRSAAAGVLIYVLTGDLGLDGTTTLSPLTTGPQSGITLFLARADAGAIKTNSTMTVNGVIYAIAGELDLQSNNANLTTGGVDVHKVEFKGNGSGLILQ